MQDKTLNILCYSALTLVLFEWAFAIYAGGFDNFLAIMKSWGL